MEVVGPLCTCTSVTNVSSGRPGDMDSTTLSNEYIFILIKIALNILKLPSPISLVFGWVGLDSWLDEDEYGT